MAKVSIAAQALTRIAARSASNNRFVRAGLSAAETTLRSFARIAHVLWLQTAGLFFIVFAVFFVSRLPRAWGDYHVGKTPQSHLLLLAALAVMFAWFGVSSFWRAKKR